MKILVHREPHPEAIQPDFVKEAYRGLLLEVEFEQTEPSERYPNGFYLVLLAEFLRKMKVHNREAYDWLAEEWVPILNAVGEGNISLLFPPECCEPIRAVN